MCVCVCVCICKGNSCIGILRPNHAKKEKTLGRGFLAFKMHTRTYIYSQAQHDIPPAQSVDSVRLVAKKRAPVHACVTFRRVRNRILRLFAYCV